VCKFAAKNTFIYNKLIFKEASQFICQKVFFWEINILLKSILSVAYRSWKVVLAIMEQRLLFHYYVLWPCIRS